MLSPRPKVIMAIASFFLGANAMLAALLLWVQYAFGFFDGLTDLILIVMMLLWAVALKRASEKVLA